jgi:hypothetical protein
MSLVADIIKTEASAEVLDEPVKKKRGRRKKVDINVANHVANQVANQDVVAPTIKRGRKPRSHTNSRNISMLMSSTEPEETLILNLKIDPKSTVNKILTQDCMTENKNQLNSSSAKQSHDKLELYRNTDIQSITSPQKMTLDRGGGVDGKDVLRVEGNTFFYTPDMSIPLAYDVKDIREPITDNKYETSNDIDANSVIDENMGIDVQNISIDLQKRIDDYTIRTSTTRDGNIVCHNCCNSFKTPPFGIPIKYHQGKYYIIKYFCMLECSARYIFSEETTVQDSWESYSLLNRMAHDLGYSSMVRLAPSKDCLQMFGGSMSIETYREFSKTHPSKIMNVLHYPMIRTTQQIEEINYNTNGNSNFIPIDHERLRKMEQRIKHLKNKTQTRNTLEQIMNIRSIT